MLLVDVGRFHRLKGTFFEHRTDDLLTRAVAERIEKALCGAKIVARIGDNDYAVLLTEEHPEQLAAVVRNVLAELKKPFGVDNDIVLPNPCMGSALYPFDGEDIQTLLRHAGTQIYSARQLGGAGPTAQTAAASTAP
ncbi:MAG: diguanylate cyclase [Gammaproteobacteria bacterium]|nr:diguanylate cyclase [Gammaproteobacteria bacterium]